MSSSGDDSSALVSFTRSGETGQSASSTSNVKCDFLDFLGVAQSLKIDFLPITWQPALDKVGEGGTAKIPQALINLGTAFAFKRLEHPSSLEEKSRNLRALIAEISVLGHPASRCHPNIMDIEGICVDVIDGGKEIWPVLVLEKTQLGDLDRFMVSGPGHELDLYTRLDILFDVALAVRDLHAAGVIHGDIKPENILIFPKDEVRHVARVTDFGYSTLFATEDDLIEMPFSGIWTAPDWHYRKILPKQGRKMDVYSFGMLCLWLLFYNQTTSRDRDFKKDLASPMDPLYHVSELLKATPDMALWERENLQKLFSLTLVPNPAERSANMQDLLHLLSPSRASYLTIPEDTIGIPLKDFEIAPSLSQLIQAHHSVRYYIVNCLEKRRDQTSISRCHTLNMALCYELGFGIRRDIVKYSRTLLSTPGISVTDLKTLKDVIEQLKECRQLPFIQTGLFRKFFEQGHFKAFDFSQQYREEQCSGEAKLHFQREIATMGSILGEDHPFLQEIRLQLSDLMSNEGRWKDAEEMLSHMIDLELANEAHYPLKRHFAADHQGNRLYPGWLLGDGNQIDGFRDVGRFALYLSSLALTYFYQRRLTDAADLQVSLFDLLIKHFGLESLGTMTCISNLAATYNELGRVAEAEQLETLVVQTREKVLGLKHPETLISMNNLATTYSNQKRWKEAEKLLIKVIRVSNEILGTEDPRTLASEMNLAMVHSHQKQWGKAAELNEKVLEIERRVLGAEHPVTLSSVRKLALIFSQQGQWKKGEEMTIQNMKIGEKILGAEDSDTLISMDNLAFIYSHQVERWADAEELYVQIIETRKRIKGTEHPDTLDSMRNLAMIYLEQDRRLEKAEELSMFVMQTNERLFGAEHPETLTSMSTLALIYSQQDERLKEAEMLFKQVMKVRKRVLGVEHTDTLDSIDNLASTYLRQGWSETKRSKIQRKWRKAEDIRLHLFETKVRVLGPEDPETLSSMKGLADIYWDQSEYAEDQEGFKKTEDLRVQIVEMRERVCGTDHPDTLKSMIELALTHKARGRCKEAEDLLARVSDMLLAYKEQGRWREVEDLESEIMETRQWIPDSDLDKI